MDYITDRIFKIRSGHFSLLPDEWFCLSVIFFSKIVFAFKSGSVLLKLDPPNFLLESMETDISTMFNQLADVDL